MRLCLALLLCSASLSVAGDWPQWLGPNRDGTSPEKIAPWKGDLKVLWRGEVGEGHCAVDAAARQAESELHRFEESERTR